MSLLIRLLNRLGITLDWIPREEAMRYLMEEKVLYRVTKREVTDIENLCVDNFLEACSTKKHSTSQESQPGSSTSVDSATTEYDPQMITSSMTEYIH